MKITYVDIGPKITTSYEHESKLNKIVHNLILRPNNSNNESGDAICNWNAIYTHTSSEP